MEVQTIFPSPPCSLAVCTPETTIFEQRSFGGFFVLSVGQGRPRDRLEGDRGVAETRRLGEAPRLPTSPPLLGLQSGRHLADHSRCLRGALPAVLGAAREKR